MPRVYTSKVNKDECSCHYCGAKICWSSAYRALREGREPRCYPCFVAQRTSSVASTTLRCSLCREWKPDQEFWKDRRRPARRFRDDECKVCASITRKRRRRQDMVPCANGCGSLVLHPRHTPKHTGMCVACANKINGAKRRTHTLTGHVS